MSVTCTRPEFPYDRRAGWYEACTSCGRLAWDHEQADPLADIRAQAKWMQDGGKGDHPAPVMRAAADSGAGT